MRKVYTIDQFQIVHNDFHFSLNENQKGIQIQPAGQVLADSDNFAFIYLIEEDDGYSYISFPQNVWPLIVDMLIEGKNPFLNVDGKLIELHNFTDETQMLLFNIEGNENYGKEFVNAVESAFEQILKGDTV